MSQEVSVIGFGKPESTRATDCPSPLDSTGANHTESQEGRIAMSNLNPVPASLDDIQGLDTNDPAVAALLQRYAELETKAQRSPRQRKSFSEMWDKRVNTPVDKMPPGYKIIVEWLIDEGHIEQEQAGLVYAACWSYQCAEGKEVRHAGGASREALREAREALEKAAHARMTSEVVDNEDEDSESEDIDDEDNDDDDIEGDDIDLDDIDDED